MANIVGKKRDDLAAKLERLQVGLRVLHQEPHFLDRVQGKHYLRTVFSLQITVAIPRAPAVNEVHVPVCNAFRQK